LSNHFNLVRISIHVSDTINLLIANMIDNFLGKSIRKYHFLIYHTSFISVVTATRKMLYVRPNLWLRMP